MYTHTVNLKHSHFNDKYYIEVPRYGYGVDTMREPEYMTKEECEELLKEKGYVFYYNSKVKGCEVWAK